MTRYGLTPEQARCLEVIQAFLDRGVSPSYDEVRAVLGLQSKAGVNRLVVALEERGFLVRLPGRARSLRLVDAGPPPSTAPTPSAWMVAGTGHRAVFTVEAHCRDFVAQFGGHAVPLYEHPPVPVGTVTPVRPAPWACPQAAAGAA